MEPAGPLVDVSRPPERRTCKSKETLWLFVRLTPSGNIVVCEFCKLVGYQLRVSANALLRSSGCLHWMEPWGATMVERRPWRRSITGHHVSERERR